MNNNERLGIMGEHLVQNLMIDHGIQVTWALNPFDRQKDLRLGKNRKKLEVKTEQPYVLRNWFSIRKDQLYKCRNADHLCIVSVPPKFDPAYKHGGKIFYVNPKTFKQSSPYTIKKGKERVEMIGIPIMQDSVQCIYKMSEEEKQLFMRYAESDYTKSDYNTL